MAFFGGSWGEDSEKEGLGPLSHWIEDLDDIEENKQLGGLHNMEDDDFDYEGVKYFKDDE